MKSLIQLTATRLRSASDLISISIEPKENLGIVGAADSGKTALLLAFMGQENKGLAFNRRTELEIAEIGYVPSNPSLLFSGMKSTLAGELQLSSQFVGRGLETLDGIVHQFGLGGLLTRDPFSLSGGEMVRAALAIVAVKKPRVWLLDQVYDSLYPGSLQEVRKLVEFELAKGHAVVETHSCAPSWADRLNTIIFLDGERRIVVGAYRAIARQVRDSNLLSEMTRLSLRLEDDLGVQIDDHDNAEAVSERLRPLIAHAHRPVSEATKVRQMATLEVEGLRFRYQSAGFALGPIDATLRGGEIVSVAGPNGSGKTTLLQCVADLLEPIRGEIRILGCRPTRRRWEWARKAFYCFQDPDDQLYLPTTSEEIDKTLQALGRPRPPDLAERYEALGLTAYLAREPYQLARPVRRLVCLAAGLIASTPVILLDEPTASLDVRGRSVIRSEIERLAAAGITFVMVSHDFSFIAETTTRILKLSDGRVLADVLPKPWPLDQLPPVIRIAFGLGLKAIRYRELLHYFAQDENYNPTLGTLQ